MNFDLNIDNYTRDELIEMFDLPFNFDRNIVEIKETKLRDKIFQNKQMNKDSQIKTINFLTKAKNIILNQPYKFSPETKKQIDALYHFNYDLKPSNLTVTNDHMILDRPNQPFADSSPSEFFTGIINPLKKKTTAKILNIDSRFRDNYFSTSATNFNVNLPTVFNDVVRMQLSSIEIPTTYYVVSKQYGNNFFTLNVNGSYAVITIPDGNYSQTTIINSINNQINLAGAPFSFISFTIDLTGGTTGSGKTLVGSNGTGAVTSLELNFQADRFSMEDKNTPLPLKFGWTLGFRNGKYVGNLNYVSEGIVNITGPAYVYLVVDDHNNNVNNLFYGAFNSSILNKNILARISLQANNFNILEQNNLNLINVARDYFGPVNIQSMTIQLLDEYGRIIDLNNMDFSFCLILTTAYDI
jgi:hypothetical protein